MCRQIEFYTCMRISFSSLSCLCKLVQYLALWQCHVVREWQWQYLALWQCHVVRASPQLLVAQLSLFPAHASKHEQKTTSFYKSVRVWQLRCPIRRETWGIDLGIHLTCVRLNFLSDFSCFAEIGLKEKIEKVYWSHCPFYVRHSKHLLILCCNASNTILLMHILIFRDNINNTNIV